MSLVNGMTNRVLTIEVSAVGYRNLGKSLEGVVANPAVNSLQ